LKPRTLEEVREGQRGGESETFGGGEGG